MTLTNGLEEVLSAHQGNRIFQDKLLSVIAHQDFPNRLLDVSTRWVLWNTVFGGAVAGLSSVVWSSAELFGRVRSSKVASRIFFAARDEFGDEKAQDTHPELAFATLGGLASSLACHGSREFIPDQQTTQLMSEVLAGYRAQQRVSEPELWRGLGFHLGSEILADREFGDFASFLENRLPATVEFMKSTKVEVDGQRYCPWSWISIHGGSAEQGGVEADHAVAASEAINLAHEYYCGSESPEHRRQWVQQGLREFCDHQTRRMSTL